MKALKRAAALGGLFVVSTVHAEPTRNIGLTVFDPTPATTTGALFQVQSADVGESGDYAASVLATYASKPLVLTTDTGVMNVVRHHTKLGVGGAYAFGGRFEAGLRIPLYLQSGDAVPAGETGVQPAEGAALGDVALSLKTRLVGDPTMKTRAGAALTLTLPTASLAGDEQFAGTRLPTVRLLGLATIDATSQLAFHVNGGAVLRETSQFANVEQGSGLTWGVGMSLRAVEKVFIDVQAFGDVLPSGDHDRPTATNVMGEAKLLTTLEGLVGAHMQYSQAMSFGIAAGRGLTAGLGEPEWRAVISFAYTPGAPKLDPLWVPPPPEVIDPNTNDADYDKLVDAKDKCPKEGEDKDGFEDDDGCPDLDNDKDNVPDTKDKCAMLPEDIDKFEDGDGCPEPDNDKDGVADGVDKCPDKPEKINGNDDADGCPDSGDSLVISNPDRLELLEPVLFNGDDISKDSLNQLNQLASTLRARADIKRIRIGVHVQPTKAPKKDQALSDRRATAIREYLTKRGIEESRLDVKPFGGTTPLVKPETKGAAMINDRIELIILERN